MEYQKPRFSVLIPTRDRADVLKWSIKTALMQDYCDLEVIVSNNCSADETVEIARGFKDERIKVITTPERLGMSQNWEFALEHISGDWVTVLGDDDGLLPGALTKAAKLIQCSGAHAVRSRTCSYSWPELLGRHSGRLNVPIKKGWETRNSSNWLTRVLNGQETYDNLPMLYNGGFVRQSVLAEIKRRSGRFFQSMTPDVYMAFAIAAVLPSYVYSMEPLSVNGASRHSGGTSIFSERKAPEAIAPAIKFHSEPNLPFHSDLPLTSEGRPPRSIQALVYEAYLQAFPLAKGKLLTTHQKQLEILLATAGSRIEEIELWGREFAGRHRLDYDAAAYSARRRTFVNSVVASAKKLSTHIYTVGIGSDLNPIRNVFEAAIAAGAILDLSPTALSNCARLARRLTASWLHR